MPVRALERLLQTERERPKMGAAGPKVPIIASHPVHPNTGPYLVTNMRKAFLPSPGLQDQTVRYAFSEVPIEEEDEILLALHRALRVEGAVVGTIQQALSRLGAHARTIIVPPSGLLAMGAPDLAEAQERMDKIGVAYQVGDVRVLLGGLGEGCAIVATTPSEVGVYSRVGDSLGMFIQRPGRTILAVCPTSISSLPTPSNGSTNEPSTPSTAGGSATSKPLPSSSATSTAPFRSFRRKPSRS